MVLLERSNGKWFGTALKHALHRCARGTDPLSDAVMLIDSGDIVFVINTPQDSGTHRDGEAIRKAANVKGVALVTTVRAARAAVQGMRERRDEPLAIRSLQEYHGV